MTCLLPAWCSVSLVRLCFLFVSPKDKTHSGVKPSARRTRRARAPTLQRRLGERCAASICLTCDFGGTVPRLFYLPRVAAVLWHFSNLFSFSNFLCAPTRSQRVSACQSRHGNIGLGRGLGSYAVMHCHVPQIYGGACRSLEWHRWPGRTAEIPTRQGNGKQPETWWPGDEWCGTTVTLKGRGQLCRSAPFMGC